MLLTPGIHNSAFFEHAFLADEMGVELCEGSDLFVENGYLYMRTTQAPKRVDVVYRRIDDAFLDPLTFRPRFGARRAGPVRSLSRRAGDARQCARHRHRRRQGDLHLHARVIEFYTGEKPLLKNVPTWRCAEPKDLAYVLDHLSELVVKEVHGSGGYGMLVGPTSSAKEIDDFRHRLKANPEELHRPADTWRSRPRRPSPNAGVAPRHIDLRPFVLTGDRIRITPGGLTRVALKDGSLVVNSSQGGGTKDTWVLED